MPLSPTTIAGLCHRQACEVDLSSTLQACWRFFWNAGAQDRRQCTSGKYIPQFMTSKMADVNIEHDGEQSSYPSKGVLMDTIRHFRAIYDKSCPDYKDQRAKRNAWQAVATKLNIDVLRSTEI